MIIGERHRFMGANDDEQVISNRKFVLKMAKRLAEHPANPVAARGIPDLSRRAEAQTGVADFVRPGVHHERPARFTNLGFVYRREILAAMKSMRFWKSVAHFAVSVGKLRDEHFESYDVVGKPTSPAIRLNCAATSELLMKGSALLAH